MKKFFALLFSLVLISSAFSCTKSAPEVLDDVVAVSFSPRITSGYIPTKSFVDEVLNNLPLNYPTKLYLRNKDKDGKDYYIDLASNSTVSVQKGEYYVDASIGVDDVYSVATRRTVPLTTGTPGKAIGENALSQLISIDEAKTYIVELSIAGFIVACNKDEASYFKLNGHDTNCFETDKYFYYIIAPSSSFLKKGDLAYTYITFELGETDAYEKTQKDFYVTTGGYNSVVGKYFLINSVENNFRQFSFSLPNPEWENGGTL